MHWKEGAQSRGALIKKLFSFTHSAAVEASKVLDKLAIETDFLVS